VSAALDRRTLKLVGEVMGCLDVEELSQMMVAVLREAVPSDWSALNELPADLPRTISITEPAVPAKMHALFARHGAQNPIVEHHLRSGDGRAIRFSDLVTRRELHRLDLYREVYQPLGVEYQIAFTLPSRSQRVLGIALSRGRYDFTAAERSLLNLARPYLIQAYRNAVDYSRLAREAGGAVDAAQLIPLGLTRRQADVLRLVAMGRSDADAADELGIGKRTVQKHLELAYRALGVNGRSQASRIAWSRTGP